MIRCVDLLQLGGALRIQCLLVERLLRLADVVQKVDVALLQSLSRLAQCTLLHAELTELTKKQSDYITIPQAGPYKPDTYRY